MGGLCFDSSFFFIKVLMLLIVDIEPFTHHPSVYSVFTLQESVQVVFLFSVIWQLYSCIYTIALIVTVLIGTALISTALFATDRVVTLCILPLRGVHLSQVVHLRLSTLCLCAFSSLRFCLESLQLCGCIFVIFSSFSRLDFKQTLCICELCTWTRQQGFVHREPYIFS